MSFENVLYMTLERFAVREVNNKSWVEDEGRLPTKRPEEDLLMEIDGFQKKIRKLDEEDCEYWPKVAGLVKEKFAWDAKGNIQGLKKRMRYFQETRSQISEAYENFAISRMQYESNMYSLVKITFARNLPKPSDKPCLGNENHGAEFDIDE